MNDTRIHELIRQLNYKTDDWLDIVDGLGNQCASTDRIIESILEISMELKEEYSKM